MGSAIETVVRHAIKTFSFSNKDPMKNFNENFTKLLSLVNSITSEDIHFDHHLLTQQVQEIKQLHTDQHSMQMKSNYIQRAPVTYIRIFENEIVTVGVFVVREGNNLPLHNHPLMHGIIKVLAGSLKITSYSVLDPEDKGGGDPTDHLSEDYHELGFTSVSDGELDNFMIPGIGLVPIPCYKENKLSASQESSSSNTLPEFTPASSLSYLKSTHLLASRHPSIVVSSQNNAIHLTPRQRNLHQLRSLDGPAAFLDVIAPPYKPIRLLDCTFFEDLGDLSPDRKSIRVLQRIPCPRYFYTDEAKYTGPPVDIISQET